MLLFYYHQFYRVSQKARKPVQGGPHYHRYKSQIVTYTMSHRGGWEAEGRQYHSQGGKQQCCVSSRAQKLPQSTW